MVGDKIQQTGIIQTYAITIKAKRICSTVMHVDNCMFFCFTITIDFYWFPLSFIVSQGSCECVTSMLLLSGLFCNWNQKSLSFSPKADALGFGHYNNSQRKVGVPVYCSSIFIQATRHSGWTAVRSTSMTSCASAVIWLSIFCGYDSIKKYK